MLAPVEHLTQAVLALGKVPLAATHLLAIVVLPMEETLADQVV